MVRKSAGPIPVKHAWPARHGSGPKQQAAALLQRAQALHGTGAYEEARKIGESVLAMQPDNAGGYHLLGTLALQRKDFAQAELLLSRAIELDRSSGYFRHSLANLYRERGDHESAANAYRKALALHPGLHPAYLGLAMALRAMGQSSEALIPLQRYLAHAPKDADAHNELGLAFKDLGELARAVEHFRLALQSRPGHMAAGSNLARTLLLAGNLDEGWLAWLRALTGNRFPGPSTGPALFDGKRVVVYGTEGVGDEIMFASCLPDLAAHGAEVTLHSDPRLVALFRRSFAGMRTLPMDKQGARRTLGFVAQDEIHVLASFLPAYFRPDPGSFPSGGSFLVPDPGQVDEWRKRLDALGDGVKVGISWRGGIDPLNRARRSLPLAAWAPLFAVPGVQWVNLQYGDARGEATALDSSGAVRLHDWPDADPLTDLDSFAAQIAALDLVVSVDNSTVHLAGALGRPVWAMLPRIPDWRWQMTGTSTPWYRSVRLFRQDDTWRWEPVVQEIRAALVRYVTDGARQRPADRPERAIRGDVA